jgi:hypothetical protein
MVTMTFPIAERTVKATIGEVDYTLVLKGSTVVSVDPAGKNCPLYQRAQYRQDQVPWREVNRFLSDQQIFW